MFRTFEIGFDGIIQTVIRITIADRLEGRPLEYKVKVRSDHDVVLQSLALVNGHDPYSLLITFNALLVFVAVADLAIDPLLQPLQLLAGIVFASLRHLVDELRQLQDIRHRPLRIGQTRIRKQILHTMIRQKTPQHHKYTIRLPGRLVLPKALQDRFFIGPAQPFKIVSADARQQRTVDIRPGNVIHRLHDIEQLPRLV